MQSQWTLLSGAIPIPTGDGMSSCVLDGKMYSVGGWQANGVSNNRVFRTADGTNWSESEVARTWSGRHTAPVIVSGGKMRVIGGDIDTGEYDPNCHSWDGLETSPWVAEPSFAPLNRIGHWALGDFGGYDWFGGGQTMTPASPAPTEFFTDRWRRLAGSTDAWQLYDGDSAIGARGFICGAPPVIDGEAFFIGGGTYQTSDYPDRLHRNDIMVMGSDFRIRCASPKNQMPGMIFHSVAELNGALVIVAGHDGSNQKAVWASFDKGKTLVRLSDFPGAATHAGTLQKFNGALYFWGGLETGQNCWCLEMVDESKVHYGAAPNGTTNMGVTYTIADRSQALVPGKTVASVGLHCAYAHAGVRAKIVRENSPTNYDVVFNGPASNHAGGGWRDFPVGFVVPNDGATYRVAFSFAYTPSQPDSYAYGSDTRANVAGDASGNGIAMFVTNDGTFPMRWTEA